MKSYVDNFDFVKLDGSNFMTADINMNEQQIKNMLDPTDEQDSVNKRYLEVQLTDYMYLKHNDSKPLSFNMNAGGYKITNLANGSDPNDVLNKKATGYKN